MQVRAPVVVLGLAITGLLGLAIGASLADDDSPSSTQTRPSASVSSTSTTSTTSTTRAEPLQRAFDACTHDQLEAGLGGHDGATGTVIWTIVVVNRGEPCSIQGFPTMSFLDDLGHELPIQAQQHVSREADPVDLFGTDSPFVLHDAPLVESAHVQIETATDRGDVPGMVTYDVDRAVLRLPGVTGSFTVPVDGMTLAQTVLVLPLQGPRGTIRD